MKIKLTIIALALSICLGGCSTHKKMSESNKLPLIGTHWNLVAIEDVALQPLHPTSKPYIVFDSLGKFNGNLGCNIFFGSYYQKKHKIELQYDGATKRLCTKMDVENALLKALKRDIDNFSIDGKTLILYSGKKEILRFEGSAN